MRRTFTIVGAQHLEEHLHKVDSVSTREATDFLGVSTTCALYILEYMEAIGKVVRKKVGRHYNFYLKGENGGEER